MDNLFLAKRAISDLLAATSSVSRVSLGDVGGMLELASGLYQNDGGFNHTLIMAVQYHIGQVDKAGEPYILHVLRVALAQRDHLRRQIGLLHDVLEDCQITTGELRMRGVDCRVLASVESLTRLPGEDYLGSYIPRILVDPLAPEVKLADLDDNLRLLRLPYLSDDSWIRRARKHHAAHRMIRDHIDARPADKDRGK